MSEEGIVYFCPNNCKRPLFYQEGNLEAIRKMDEAGNISNDDTYDFTPTGPVRCRGCQAEATKKIKRTIFIDPE